MKRRKVISEAQLRNIVGKAVKKSLSKLKLKEGIYKKKLKESFDNDFLEDQPEFRDSKYFKYTVHGVIRNDWVYGKNEVEKRGLKPIERIEEEFDDKADALDFYFKLLDMPGSVDSLAGIKRHYHTLSDDDGEYFGF